MNRRPVRGVVEDRARPAAGDVEQRNNAATAPTIDGPRLRGLIPYGVESRDLGGFREIIEPGALRGARLDDLVATVDHAGVPLARHPGTLAVEDRADGLHWSLELPESRADVREAVQRGDLCAGSWRMVVGRDRWDGDVRHVEQIAELHDVSVVSSPAYAASVVEHRSAPNGPERAPSAPQRGTLRVGDRHEQPSRRPVEDRVLDALRSVPQGEARDLTRAVASPVEPPELSTLLWDRLRDDSIVLRSGVRIVTTSREELRWPMLTGDVTADFYNELEEIAESDPTFADFVIAPKAIKALVRGSSEAFEDSDPDLLRLVQAHLQTILALKLDRECLVGNAAKGFLGLTQAAGTQTIAVGGALANWDPILKAVGLLAEQKVPGPYAVLAHPRVVTALGLVKELSNSQVGLAKPAAAPNVFTSGQMTVTTGASPSTTVIVYSPSQVVLARRRDVTVEVDRSQEFSSDAVLVRGKVRAALGVPRPEAIVKLTGVAAPPIS